MAGAAKPGGAWHRVVRFGLLGYGRLVRRGSVGSGKVRLGKD